MSQWSIEDVSIWLDLIQLSEHRAEFLKQSVSGAELLELDADDLNELGVTKMGHKKRLMKRIKMLKYHLDEAWSNSSLDSSEESSTQSGSWSKSSVSLADFEKDITFKCYCEDNISVLHFSSVPTWPKLKRKIKKEYGAKMLVKYQDADGDKIRIKKTSHLEQAIAEAQNETVRLYLSERKRKMSSTQESVLDTMLDGVVIINRKGKLLFFNKAAEVIFGYNLSAVLKKNVSMLMSAEDASKHDGYLDAYHKTKKAHIIGIGRTVQAKHKDGHLFPVRLSVTESRQKGHIIFTGTITKLEKVVQQPQLDHGHPQPALATSTPAESQNNMFALLNKLLDACVVMNESAIIQFWNTAAETKFGWTATEIIGKNVKLLMPKQIGDLHDGYVQRYLSTNEAQIIGMGREVVAQRKDGSVAPFHLSVTEQQLEGGRRLFTGILREVSGRTQAERTKTVLQQEREVLDNLCVPAIIIDQTGRIHAFNEAASELLGYKLIEVISRNVSMLMNSEEAKAHNGYISNYLQTRQPKMIGKGREVIAVHKNGSLVPVYLSIAEKQDGDKYIFTGILQKK